MILSIVGLPGAGKTGVIRALGALRPCTAWPERVEDFPLVAHGAGGNQHLVFLNQADFVLRKIGQAACMRDVPGLHVVEVDWSTCHAQWTGALWRSGRISAAHRDGVQLIHDAAVSAGVPGPDRIYYLHASVDVLLARIAARARDFESSYAGFVRDLAEIGPARLEEMLGRRIDVLDARAAPEQTAARIAAEIDPVVESDHAG